MSEKVELVRLQGSDGKEIPIYFSLKISDEVWKVCEENLTVLFTLDEVIPKGDVTVFLWEVKVLPPPYPAVRVNSTPSVFISYRPSGGTDFLHSYIHTLLVGFNRDITVDDMEVGIELINKGSVFTTIWLGVNVRPRYATFFPEFYLKLAKLVETYFHNDFVRSVSGKVLSPSDWDKPLPDKVNINVTIQIYSRGWWGIIRTFELPVHTERLKEKGWGDYTSPQFLATYAVVDGKIIEGLEKMDYPPQEIPRLAERIKVEIPEVIEEMLQKLREGGT